MAFENWIPIALGPGCVKVELIEHEFLHALGVLHEQDCEQRFRDIILFTLIIVFKTQSIMIVEEYVSPYKSLVRIETITLLLIGEILTVVTILNIR